MLKKIGIVVTAVCLIGLALCSTWLGSGSIAPYASSYARAEVGVCGYLYNIDHPHFYYTFQMLDGVPKSVWEMGVVFRRILYPIIAYPFMRQWGFNLGGFITNLMLVALGALGLFIFLLKKFGFRAALVGGLLFGSYPGLTYFGGLPYCYIFIAPATIFAFISLTRMDENPTYRSIIFTSFFIGVLATGYDLLPFLLPVMIIILARHKRFFSITSCVCLAIIPLAFVIWYQTNITGISPNNSNSDIYPLIIKSYLNPPKERFEEWMDLLLSAPGILMHNFTFSTFGALPIAFCLVYLASRRVVKARLTTPEAALLLVALAIWCFNNFAPPYPGWQARGFWIARFYQPIFIVFIVYISRMSALVPSNHKNFKWLIGATCACVAFHIAVITSPLLGYYKLSGRVYHEFYQHATPGFFGIHMDKWGVRPRGFCK